MRNAIPGQAKSLGRGPAGSSGFTLIELLIVIVILGLLYEKSNYGHSSSGGWTFCAFVVSWIIYVHIRGDFESLFNFVIRMRVSPELKK